MAFGTRTETLDDFYTTTWNNRSSAVVDQVFKAMPFWKWMQSRKAIKFQGSGGRFLEIPLSIAKNTTVTSIGKGDSISLSDTQFMTVAQYQWKFAAGNIIRYFTDDEQNKGEQQLINWVNAKVNNLRESFTDYFEGRLFSDGTGNGGKDINGLDNLVSTTPTTGTVGNINRATNAYWQNKQKTSTGAASVYLESDMNNLWNNCSKGQNSDEPTVMVTDQTSHELYQQEVQELKRIHNTMEGDPTFTTVTFRGAPVIWSPQSTAGRMYFLNDRYLSLVIDPDVNFRMTDWKSIPNSLDRVAQVVVKMEFVMSRSVSQGVLTAIAA